MVRELLGNMDVGQSLLPEVVHMTTLMEVSRSVPADQICETITMEDSKSEPRQPWAASTAKGDLAAEVSQKPKVWGGVSAGSFLPDFRVRGLTILSTEAATTDSGGH